MDSSLYCQTFALDAMATGLDHLVSAWHCVRVCIAEGGWHASHIGFEPAMQQECNMTLSFART